MGEVYRARDTRLGRDVAIKVLPQHLTASDGARARFEREARLVSGLSHPNIGALYDIGREGSTDYLVMELVDGETLADRIARGPLPTAEVLRIGAQIADALEAAHRAGVVHRDLKPSNVMLSRSGAKLMDFGLARGGGLVHARSSPGPGLTHAPTVAGALTTEGSLIGTFQYMAPEQLEGRDADARCDLWALGCVLYEMATGKRAFDGPSQASLISVIMKEEPRPMTQVATMTPAHLDLAVRACLAKDPDQRWQSAHDLAIALRWPWSEAGSSSRANSGVPIERHLLLTTTQVRQLSVKNPRLVGYPLTYMDNQVASDRLVVLLHGVGADDGRFETVLRTSRYRAVAVTLVGFGRSEANRPILGIDDHSRVLRLLLRDLVTECRPRQVVLVGHSGGSDQFLRMMHDPEGAGPGVDIAGIVALAPNVSLDTCFATRVYANMDASNPTGTLATLKALAADVQSLESWLVIQSYLSQSLIRLGVNLEPLKRYAREVMEPFQKPGDPLADWYRVARARIPVVRLVFGAEESVAAEALLARHLDDNVLGDDFASDSFVIEPVHHLTLLEPERIQRHITSVFDALDHRG
jgi:pimeloyl-ACP methyl ester carboxylesterase